ncbi:MAG: hypothetical protein QW259_03955 [Pyrobaculum sp.]
MVKSTQLSAHHARQSTEPRSAVEGVDRLYVNYVEEGTFVRRGGCLALLFIFLSLVAVRRRGFCKNIYMFCN